MATKTAAKKKTTNTVGVERTVTILLPTSDNTQRIALTVNGDIIHCKPQNKEYGDTWIDCYDYDITIKQADLIAAAELIKESNGNK